MTTKYEVLMTFYVFVIKRDKEEALKYLEISPLQNEVTTGFVRKVLSLEIAYITLLTSTNARFQ